MSQKKSFSVRALIPSLMRRTARSLLNKATLSSPVVEGERAGDWYDQAFRNNSEYSLHYRQSQYYYLWCVVVDRVLRAGAVSVLDIGCGPGQVAQFFKDKGLATYIGLDLSPVAINMARRLCPKYTFIAASAFETDILERADIDTVVSMEFLEHVNDELSVLKRIRGGVRFIGTVPNFAYASHVRHFTSCEEVVQRYASLFHSFTVDVFDAPTGSNRFFLMQGVRL